LVPVEGNANANPIGRTPSFGVEVALVLRSKKELSFYSSSLMGVREESTSSFHSPNDLLNATAADSRGDPLIALPVCLLKLREAVVDDGCSTSCYDSSNYYH
jgi:hypothetical protein